jgi:hypothetical protein
MALRRPDAARAAVAAAVEAAAVVAVVEPAVVAVLRLWQPSVRRDVAASS